MPTFRTRDVIAAILALLLSQLLHSYDHGSESLTAEINLAFYAQYKSSVPPLASQLADNAGNNGSDQYNYSGIDIARPVPFDLDGDGLVEALVVPSLVSNSNLKSSTNNNRNRQGGNDRYNNKNWWTLKVYDLNPFHSSSQQSKSPLMNPNTIYETNQNKNDYEDANNRIPIKVITGHVRTGPQHALHKRFRTTSKGTLPSMISIWNNGDIVLHSITTALNLEYEEKSKNHELDLMEMWSINPFMNALEKDAQIQFEEIDLVFNDSHDTNDKYGSTVIFGTNYYLHRHSKISTTNTNKATSKDPNIALHTTFFAIDAYNGKIIWRQSTTQSNMFEQQEVLEMNNNNNNNNSHTVENEIHKPTDIFTNVEDCLKSYNNWVINPSTNILPHSFNNPKDAKIHLTHLHESNLIQPLSSSLDSSSISDDGIPNVLVFHNRRGINVISLFNGEPICFTPFSPGIVYADLSQDKTIDHLQVNTKGDNKWFQQHMEDVNSYNQESESYCHATMNSTNERGKSIRKFDVHLCSGKIAKSLEINQQMGVSIAPPLLVESFNGVYSNKSTNDIIFAINHGSIQRYDANGSIQWRKSRHDSIPKWHEEANEKHGFLDRIDFKLSYDETSADRPIISFGDDKMTILSAGEGKILCSESFPQLAVGKPILVDLNGDGTTDVLVISRDGVWGYFVRIKGISYFIVFAILLLLLLFFIALVNVREGKGERATDL